MSPRSWRFAILFSLAGTSSGSADILHMIGGMTIEVDSVQDRGGKYRVHSWQGTYEIDKRRVDWIENKPRTPTALTPGEREARKQAKAEQAEVRRRVSEWHVKIKAIDRGRLSVKDNDPRRPQFADGRQQILAIRDPFAIQPLSEVLSRGATANRMLLVEALSKFTEDESTMNLVVLALLDPSGDVRDAAAQALKSRVDERIATALVQALTSENDKTIRSAAAALGKLKIKAAIPDLIEYLSTETIARVRVTDPLFLDYMMYLYGRPVGYGIGQVRVLYQPAGIGAIGSSTLIGQIDRYELAVVSVYRTEVQEALIAITGQNFGFDRDAWAAWWRDQK